MAFTEAASPPTDIISSIRFAPDSSALIVGSWDRSIRLYSRNAEDSFSLTRNVQTEAPIFDVCWGADASTFFAVGIQEEVVCYNGDNKFVLSNHEKASNRVAYSKEHDMVVSTSWDETMHVHDPVSRRYIRVALPAKAFALSLTAERAVVAMSERKVNVYDLQALKSLLDRFGRTESAQPKLPVEPWQERMSSLKFMTRAIACMPDGAGFAIASIEGRCGVEWFDPALEQNTFVFKCHREKTTIQDAQTGPSEVDVIYPVNALAFHPTLGSFLTGGGEGTTAFWDPKTKRRIRQYPKEDAGVAAMDISSDANFLAVAVSPGFEDDNLEENPDQSKIKVLIRRLGPSEGKVKAKK